MPLAAFPKTPYLLTQTAGGVYTALATVGAVAHDHPEVQAWNPFARNDTKNRNIIMFGHDADAELRYLSRNEYFNPYAFATTTVVLDCQRLYEMLHHGADPIRLEHLIAYCFPDIDIASLSLHNAGNDAYWELRCGMVLLRKIAEQYAPESKEMAAFPKIWDAIFVGCDVEAMNGKPDWLTEFGFACLDSRDINSIHDSSYENHITASHIIVKGNVPAMQNGKRGEWRVRRYHCNHETDSFSPHLGRSEEVWPARISRIANHLFFVRTSKTWDWIAPAGLKPWDSGSCRVETSSAHWPVVVRSAQAGFSTAPPGFIRRNPQSSQNATTNPAD